VFKIEHPIQLDASAIAAANLTDRFDPEDLKRIGAECKQGLDRDEQSRAVWLRRNEAGMDLALQVVKDKTFPWPGASNIAFPLVAIAAQQFHARAYPALLGSADIVKCRVGGADLDGMKTARAERVSTQMSWQVTTEDKPWEEQTDKQLLNLSIVGTNFKKSYRKASHNVSELVLAKDLILNYWAKSVEDCPRKTHFIPLFRNDIRERVLKGTFRDVLEEAWFAAAPPNNQTQTKTNADNRQGQTPPPPDSSAPFRTYEQHCVMDLDGDGYAEPYIITFDYDSAEVVRIVTRFEDETAIERVATGPRKGEIIRIEADEYFTKYSFIPSPDGGIYDLGFGVFLGPLNETTNSLINQLVDAGTMQNTAGGFLGRGAKIRGGVYTFAPLEWKRVDSTGDDLKKSIFPLPVREPSMVLFQLLGLLISYTNRLSGATDLMVGENPGQNTPAETSRLMAEMGQKLYNAIFKRVWRAMGAEFLKLYKLNGRYMGTEPGVGGATRDDYVGLADIFPAADPNITSDVMQVQLAGSLKQAAMTTPGYNRDAVERRWLKAMKVDNVDEIFPGSEGQEPPKDPRITIAEMKLQSEQMRLAAEKEEFMISLMEEQRVNNAEILKLQAQAAEAAANAQSEQAYAQVALINAQVASVKTRNDSLNARIEQLLKMRDLSLKERQIDKEPAHAE